MSNNDEWTPAARRGYAATNVWNDITEASSRVHYALEQLPKSSLPGDQGLRTALEDADEQLRRALEIVNAALFA